MVELSNDQVPPKDTASKKQTNGPRGRKVFWRVLLWSPILFVSLAYLWIEFGYNHRIYQDLQTLPEQPVALVLGTSKRFMGRPNLYYEYRLNAAAALYHAGKIRGILVSGDNSTTAYDEPSDMKNDLIQRGIPEMYITLDYAGFRTLDSVVRTGKIFQQNAYIIVSQRFHCQRALFLAHMQGHDALAYPAEDIPLNSGGLNVHLREIMARAKALLDILTFKQPHFLGPPEPLPLKPL